MKRTKIVLAVVLLLFALTGCSIKPTGITVEPMQSLKIGEQAQISTTFGFDKDVGDEEYIKAVAALELSYSSDNEGVAKVDQNGIVTALSAGECQITVMSGELYTTVAVLVEPRIDSIALPTTEGTLYFGEELQLTPTVAPEVAEIAYEFSSSDLDIAEISDGGLITAKSVAGTCVITVSAKGYSDIAVEYKLTVTARPAGGSSGNSGSGGAGQSSGGESPAQAGIDGGGTAEESKDSSWTGMYCSICGSTSHMEGVCQLFPMCDICGYEHATDVGHYTCWCGAVHDNGTFHYDGGEWAGQELPEL